MSPPQRLLCGTALEASRSSKRDFDPRQATPAPAPHSIGRPISSQQSGIREANEKQQQIAANPSSIPSFRVSTLQPVTTVADPSNWTAASPGPPAPDVHGSFANPGNFSTPTRNGKERQHPNAPSPPLPCSDHAPGGGKGKAKRPVAANDNDKTAAKRPKTGRAIHPTRTSLACPFYKRGDPKGHPCAKYVVAKNSYLKQHLRRVHQVGELCKISTGCQLAEADTSKWLPDLKYSAACKADSYGLLTPAQMAALEPHAKRGEGEREQWYAIWDVLFLGVARPLSPYRYDDSDITSKSDLEKFLEWVYLHGATVFESPQEFLLIQKCIQTLHVRYQQKEGPEVKMNGDLDVEPEVEPVTHNGGVEFHDTESDFRIPGGSDEINKFHKDEEEDDDMAISYAFEEG
ncbi:hypothetical protein QBC46DRAFT_345002 [Diplogelasinospora grovesii]|uniref:Uncharacterized protein n=1 Tax=Diplogelasinospora grovesii TaxID=303347 RepID=A0AAN6N3B2_9PEZI|nr:hypothetical protein QBC46DRAFT_345002 [Diplogelasinospora grovesii]